MSGLKDILDVEATVFSAIAEELAESERAEHDRRHEELLLKTRSLKDGFESGQSVLTNEVLDFLQDWVTHHILKADRQYTECLAGKVF